MRGSSKLGSALQVLKRKDPYTLMKERHVLIANCGQPDFYKKVKEKTVVTSKGIKADLIYYENVDPSVKEPWVCHLIEPRVQGEIAGYLKIIYVPRVKQKALFPDVLHYAVREKHAARIELDELLSKKDWDDEDFITALKATDQWTQGIPEYTNWSSEELRSEWQQRKRKIKSEYKHAYQRFLDFHVDKPTIDFIRVYQAGEKLNHIHKDKKKEVQTDFLQKGVASSLYKEGALWMDEKGLQLYGSSLQTPEASAAWEKMKKEGILEEKDDRLLIAVNQI